MIDIVDEGIINGAEQMHRDAQLIVNLQNLQKPLLRLYQWQRPTITYGCFIDPEQHLYLPIEDIDLAQRPTGGGLLFHWYDFAFTLAIPHSHFRFSHAVLDNYHWINEAMLQAIMGIVSHGTLAGANEKSTATLGQFCMATATQYDILLKGRKIGGAAQRKTKYGYIHQSSIFLLPPPWKKIAALLKNGEELVDVMQQVSGALLIEPISVKELMHIRQIIQREFVRKLQNAFI